MPTVFLVFPHQLFEQCAAIAHGKKVYLVEEWLFFRQYNFHKAKLAFHRASMQYFRDLLIEKEVETEYIESNTTLSDIRELVVQLKIQGVAAIETYTLHDNWLQQRIKNACKLAGISFNEIESPYFVSDIKTNNQLFNAGKKFSQLPFYSALRKKTNILMQIDGAPEGGKWSYDEDNRKKFPKNQPAPHINKVAKSSYVVEALSYVAKNFPKNYGDAGSFTYPATHAEANTWLQDFLENRFALFGDYEDAIVSHENILHHSVLSPLLNSGLLTPGQALNKIMAHAVAASVPINSTEGLVRQILGWREYVFQVYARAGSQQRTKNYWKFTRKIPSSFWTASTGIQPVDDVIAKVLKTGYCHHIERLMIMGNFMLLCEFAPDDVYQWFMELFIDSYDWVMVPNVYGMSQFADGGMMTTKPYISGSNYILKMSDYKKGEWCKIWDGLFWRFMDKHRNYFNTNPRLGMLLKSFDKMDPQKRGNLLETAETFLEELNSKK